MSAEPSLSPSRLIALAGLACVGAGVLILLTQLGDVVMLNEDEDAPAVVANSVVKLLAFVLLLFGLLGLYAGQVEAAGKLALVGFVLAFLGTTLVAGDVWFETFAVPYIESKAPDLIEEPPGSTLVVGGFFSFLFFALGWLLFGIASVRAGVFPRWAAILLIVGGVAGFGILSLPFAGVPLAVAAIWMGYSLYRSRPVAPGDLV